MSHYSIAQKTEKLIKWSNDAIIYIADEIALLNTEHNCKHIPLFAYRGMSGVGLAAALSIAYYSEYGSEYVMAYVRKDGETSHGDPIEIQFPEQGCARSSRMFVIFVDDFICSGETFDKTVGAVKDYIKQESIISAPGWEEFYDIGSRPVYALTGGGSFAIPRFRQESWERGSSKTKG